MGKTTWRQRAAAVWRWARRMLAGVPSGGRIRLADLEKESSPDGRPALSIVVGQWPGRRIGDAVVSDRIRGAEIRQLVRVASRSGLSAPSWRVHGIETMPRGPERIAEWLVGVAGACSGGEIVVDTATMSERGRGELEAHLRRLAPRADVEVKTARKKTA